MDLRRAARLGLTALISIVSVLAVAVSPSSAADIAGAYNVHNWSDSAGNVGVIHVYRSDHKFALGNYDAKLAPGHSSRADYGWPHTSGIYIAPGHNVEITLASNNCFRYVNAAAPTWVWFDSPNETYFIKVDHGKQFC